MAKFKITFIGSTGKEPEEVEADDFIDEDSQWITFRKINTGGGASQPIEQVLRVRANSVSRIERV